MAQKEAFLPGPQRRSLALTTKAVEVVPPKIVSTNGKLYAMLEVNRRLTRHWREEGVLRNYNGALVGPTLNCKPGDTVGYEWVDAIRATRERMIPSYEIRF